MNLFNFKKSTDNLQRRVAARLELILIAIGNIPPQYLTQELVIRQFPTDWESFLSIRNFNTLMDDLGALFRAAGSHEVSKFATMCFDDVVVELTYEFFKQEKFIIEIQKPNITHILEVTLLERGYSFVYRS